MSKPKNPLSRTLSYLRAEVSTYFSPIAGAASETHRQWQASADRFEKRMADTSPSLPQLIKRELLAASKETPALFFAPAVGFVKGALKKR